MAESSRVNCNALERVFRSTGKHGVAVSPCRAKRCERSWLRVGVRSAALIGLSSAMACASAAAGVTPSTEEAISRGLVYVMQNSPQGYGYLGFGCGFVDLDNDNDPDVLIIGAADGHVGVFENAGYFSGQFVDRSATSGITTLPQGSAMAAADFDGDGDLDINVTQLAAGNRLLRNNGGFTFSNVTVTAGVGDTGAGKGCAWGDFDNDGWVDLFIANYEGIVPNTSGKPDRLYRNLGNGSFADVTSQHQINAQGFGFQPGWFDYDRDGDVDLYLCNDRGHLPPLMVPNQLYRNDNGVLVNASAGSGANMGLFAMGLALGDLNGDRWPDMYVTNIGNEGGNYPVGNPLFLNVGNGTFTQSAAAAGVQVQLTGWGCIFYDFDNNAQLDLYVNNQWAPNWMFLNFGSFPLANFAAGCNVLGSIGPMGGSVASFGSAVADIDNDGDLDLLLNNLGGNVQLYVNHEGELQSWIKYTLVGLGPNTAAIGGSIDTRTGSKWQWREVISGSNSYLSQNELTIHVGLGGAQAVNEAVARWPGAPGFPTGTVARTLTNLPAQHTWSIYPPSRLGDVNNDGLVLLNEFFTFADCFAKPVFLPGCEIMDFDGDSDVGLNDFDFFLAVYDEPVTDCNGNGQPDLREVLLSPGLDANTNGVLDACESPGDINGDGSVNIDDLLAIINNWNATGRPGTVQGDANGDGVVNIDDLLMVINHWG